MSLLTICQGVAGVLNIPVPSSIVGNNLPDPVLLLNLAKREGHELSRRHDWQALVNTQTWTTTATEAQTSAIPSAFDHFVPDVEVWDRTNNRKLRGPTPSNEWSQLYFFSTGGAFGSWRMIGGVLNIRPAPTAGYTYAFDYISKNWCQSSGSVAQSTWAADNDTGLISERLMELGVTWRYLRAKGMDYAEEMATYEREVEKAASRDRGLSIMVVGDGGDDDGPSQPGWTGTVTV